MKVTLLSTLTILTTAFALPSAITRRAVDGALIPQFGVSPGQNTDSVTCEGVRGARIPCTCPPDRTDFIKKLDEFVEAENVNGIKFTFPIGNDKASKQARIKAAIVTLQNFKGRGVGCPLESTTFVQQYNCVGRWPKCAPKFNYM